MRWCVDVAGNTSICLGYVTSLCMFPGEGRAYVVGDLEYSEVQCGLAGLDAYLLVYNQEFYPTGES